MKFPGKRKSKHYFPVNARDPLLQQIQPEDESSVSWVVGIDQTLVDIEAKVDEAFIVRYGLSAGHSLVIEDDVAEALYQELVRNNLITHQFAGGTIGNTMHNYSVLADDRSGAAWRDVQQYRNRRLAPIVTCAIPPAAPI